MSSEVDSTSTSELEIIGEKLVISDDDPALKLNLKGHKRAVTDISFHPQNDQFVSGSEDNSIMLWKNSLDNVRSYNFIGHTQPVTCVEFSSNGKLVASSSLDQTVRLWIPSIKGGCTEFKAHTSAIRTVSFSSDNRKLLTGSNDKSIKIWDVGTKQFICSYVGHNNWVRCARFSLDGNIITSCADDRTVRIWDRVSGQCVHIFSSAKGSPNYLALHKNGNSLAVAMNSGSVRIYDIRAQKIQQHYVLHDDTLCVCWHPLANYLLTSGKDAKLRIVDVMEGRPLYTLSGHEGPVHCAKFNSNGDRFASGGEDKCVMVWKTNFINAV